MKNKTILLLTILLTSCGGGGGGGKDKSFFSIWESEETYIAVDFRELKFDQVNEVYFMSTVSSVICVCDVTVTGTSKSGRAIAENCTGTIDECEFFDDTYAYEKSKNKLLICDSYGCADYK